MANPVLPEERRQKLVRELMVARRAVGLARRNADPAGLMVARTAVDDAKRALGERGPVWWDDGAADLNRAMATSTPYAAWYKSLTDK